MCYKIEHYGREIETDKPCEMFKNKADYVEVRHGKWIYVETDENDMAIVKCSECNTKRYGTQKYCGECGAKTDGKRKESEVKNNG
jgi:uncharacterized OB-fold protein